MQKFLTSVIGLCVVLVVASSATPAWAQQAVRNGEIVTIDAEAKSFVVKTARGETKILTTAKTVITEGEKTLGFDDLAVGDTVKVTGVRKAAGVEAEEIHRTPKQTATMH